MKGMGETHKDIRESQIVANDCRERFLPLDSPCAQVLREHDVSLAGISDLRTAYEIGRLDPNFHVLIFTLAGAGRLYTQEGRHRLRKGMLMILPAHTAYRYVLAAKRWKIMWFHLRVRKTWTALEGRDCQISETPLIGDLETACNGLLREASAKGDDAVRAGEVYAELIDIFLRRIIHMHDEPYERRTYDRLRRLWGEVDANLARCWTVKDLARQAHMSRGHFHRTVMDLYGTSPMRYVTRLRMQRAEILLRNTDDTLASIAARVGFENPFAFSVAFKRHAGMSPKFFRRQRSS